MDPRPPSDGTPSLGAYLRDWLEVQRTRLQPSTWHSYEANVRLYLLPRVGDASLSELTVARVERLYADLLREGGRRGRPLSPRTVQYAAAVLHKALADAVRTELLDRNVATYATRPRLDRDGRDPEAREVQVWTGREVRRFLATTTDDPLRHVWVVALGTGMRRGEILGLRWQDVDLDRSVLHVRRALSVVDGRARLKATKNSRSRSIAVDDQVVAALEERRALQDRQRAAVDGGWKDRWGLVFTEDDGANLDPMRVTVHFRDLVRRLDVPVVRMHDLRHAHATLCVQAGIPIKVVSARLGHSTVRITLDTYAHVLPAMDEDAAARFAEHVYGDDDV